MDTAKHPVSASGSDEIDNLKMMLLHEVVSEHPMTQLYHTDALFTVVIW